MLWSCCHTRPGLAEAMLAKGDQKIVENSTSDYFWSCGRNRRGHNHYGKALMSVRSRLRQKQKPDDESA
jgi:predicted NAD-dependent protein-ADP-ribosyltransferase YbiA (DUF1768 family)